MIRIDNEKFEMIGSLVEIATEITYAILQLLAMQTMRAGKIVITPEKIAEATREEMENKDNWERIKQAVVESTVFVDASAIKRIKEEEE